MNNESQEGRTPSRKNNLVLTMAVGASLLVLAFSAFPTLRGGLASSNMMMDDNNNDNNGHDMSTITSTTLPHPNDNSAVLEANASKALFEPALGLTNVFGPSGLFPMNKTFSCANALTCGVSAGNDAKFMGTFEKGNNNNLTSYEATYTSPITYGPQQMAGHTYKLVLTDTKWNSTDAAMPTRQAEFTRMVNNVGFNQIQHGASMIDRSDVPQFLNAAFLYGHAKVIDVTDGNKVVAKDVFTHVMVAHVMNERTFYRSQTDEAASPTVVLVFAVNIPSGVDLPGKGSLTPNQAQSFTPLPGDRSLTHTPNVNYPVQIPVPRNGSISAPQPQSTTWPVDNPKQPLFFDFLVYQNTDVKLKSMMPSSTETSSMSGR